MKANERLLDFLWGVLEAVCWLFVVAVFWYAMFDQMGVICS